MSNVTYASVDMSAPRTELHELLKLTSCEVSVNNLPAGAAIPFVHAHKQNEETYIVLSGSGEFYADGEVTPIAKGSVVKVLPACHRCMKAGADGLSYICIQAKEGSLTEYTMGDAELCEEKAQF